MLDAETDTRSRLVIPPVPAGQRGHAVAAWSEPMVIDTYLPSPPSRFPSFLDERVYQGSSGRIYPLPHHEQISTRKRPHTWQALHLENSWVRLVLLPELGGRIHVGYDKVADYDFFYRNNVIKPALVGLAGPWISGGVEFNWPQHHRPGTFLPTDWEIEREDDGAVTVWCSDHDPMTRMKGMHGIRLRPDSTVVEARVRLHNRTDLPQTFLWWANVAAAVNDDYQSFFPPDVRQVADHAKRAVTSFPHAGTYYGVDYPARVTAERPDADRLDWYRNIPVPTSYMVTSTRHAFFGGYDHGHRAGFVHWADPAVSPGKKQWTWGNAAFGHAWDANLTDDDGPYVELMAGVFTDNQPDFAFIAPGETKSFSQFWYPIREIGPAHHATLDVAVRLDVVSGTTGESLVDVCISATRSIPDAVIEVRAADGSLVAQWIRSLRPDATEHLVRPVEVADLEPRALTLTICAGGTELLRWCPGAGPEPEPLRPAVEPPAPAAIGTSEELVLTGGHLEQYRHATRRPQPYWQEALRRDPDDIRANVALGARLDADGLAEEAGVHFRRAVERLTALAPTPRTGEAHYRWGRSLAADGRSGEAMPLLARAAWDAAWFAPATWVMARIAARAGDPVGAETHARAILDRDPNHLGAGCLLVSVLRATGREEAADLVLHAQLARDPLHQWSRDLAQLPLTDDAPTLLDVALDHADCGAVDDALRVLELAAAAAGRTALGQVQVGPLVHYHRAMLLQRSDPAAAQQARTTARTTDGIDCLASRAPDIRALLAALSCGPDPRAQLLLGNWWYDRGRHQDAIAAWTAAVATAEQARDRDIVVIASRNLGVAAVNVLHDSEEAVRQYGVARGLAPDDARLLSEEDQLLARRGTGAAQRLARLAARPGLVADRDDLTVTTARLLAELDRPDEAVKLLQERRFQPWEGGEGQVLAAWEHAQIGIARRAMATGDGSGAVAAMERAVDTPQNLGEARHPLANAAELHWWWGRALDLAGDHDAAAIVWDRAAQFSGDFTDMSTRLHSGQSVYSVLALRALGRAEEAAALLRELVDFVDELSATPAAIDYFATSLPSMLLFHTDPQESRNEEIAALRAAIADLAGVADAADVVSAPSRGAVPARNARPVATVASGDHRDQRKTP